MRSHFRSEEPRQPNFERDFLPEFIFYPINLAEFWASRRKENEDETKDRILKWQVSKAAPFTDLGASTQTTLTDLKDRLDGQPIPSWTPAGQFLKLLIVFVVDSIIPASTMPETQQKYAAALGLDHIDKVRDTIIEYVSTWMGLQRAHKKTG